MLGKSESYDCFGAGNCAQKAVRPKHEQLACMFEGKEKDDHAQPNGSEPPCMKQRTKSKSQLGYSGVLMKHRLCWRGSVKGQVS